MVVVELADPVIDGFVIEKGNAENSCINVMKEGGGLLNLGGS